MDILDLSRKNVLLSRTWFKDQDWTRYGVNIGECLEYLMVSLFNKMILEELSGESSSNNIIIGATSSPETSGQDRGPTPNPPGLGGTARTDTITDTGSSV
jgi:hypothetical protein